jgi:hypothetical protein
LKSATVKKIVTLITFKVGKSSNSIIFNWFLEYSAQWKGHFYLPESDTVFQLTWT